MAKVSLRAGAAVAAVLASGIATYFFTQTPTGKTATKKIKTTASELGKAISHRVAATKKITKEYYTTMVDDLVEDYAKRKKIAHASVKALKQDLKRNWKEVQKELKAK